MTLFSLSQVQVFFVKSVICINNVGVFKTILLLYFSIKNDCGQNSNFQVVFCTLAFNKCCPAPLNGHPFILHLTHLDLITFYVFI